jgi:hypothetical protein
VISWFLSLDIGDKLIVIGCWLLGVIALLAWDVFIAKRLDAKRLPTNTLSQGVEECKKSTTRPYKDSNHQKHKGKFRIHYACHLLSGFHQIVKNDSIGYSTNNEGDECKEPPHRIQPKKFGLLRFILPSPISVPCHIGTIVNKLLRRVNQSGKEP